MSEQIKDDTKNGGTAAAPSETLSKSEKPAAELPEDELSKISGGITQPHADQY
jgi:bacteriocin-like protein